MNFRLVVADLIGTTLEDDGAVETALKSALEQQQLAWDPEAFARMRGRNKQDMIAEIVAQQGRPREQAGVIHAAFVRNLREHYRNSPLRWVPGAEQAFRELAVAGVRLVLATGFPEQIRDGLRPRVPWRSCLAAFLSGDDVQRGRPAPDVVLEAMKRAGVEQAELVVVVGDTPADIACGRAAAAGLVVAVTSGAGSRQDLERAQPDLLLASIAELPAALAKLEAAHTKA